MPSFHSIKVVSTVLADPAEALLAKARGTAGLGMGVIGSDDLDPAAALLARARGEAGLGGLPRNSSISGISSLPFQSSMLRFDSSQRTGIPGANHGPLGLQFGVPSGPVGGAGSAFRSIGLSGARTELGGASLQVIEQHTQMRLQQQQRQPQGLNLPVAGSLTTDASGQRQDAQDRGAQREALAHCKDLSAHDVATAGDSGLPAHSSRGMLTRGEVLPGNLEMDGRGVAWDQGAPPWESRDDGTSRPPQRARRGGAPKGRGKGRVELQSNEVLTGRVKAARGRGRGARGQGSESGRGRGRVGGGGAAAEEINGAYAAEAMLDGSAPPPGQTHISGQAGGGLLEQQVRLAGAAAMVMSRQQPVTSSLLAAGSAPVGPRPYPNDVATASVTAMAAAASGSVPWSNMEEWMTTTSRGAATACAAQQGKQAFWPGPHKMMGAAGSWAGGYQGVVASLTGDGGQAPAGAPMMMLPPVAGGEDVAASNRRLGQLQEFLGSARAKQDKWKERVDGGQLFKKNQERSFLQALQDWHANQVIDLYVAGELAGDDAAAAGGSAGGSVIQKPGGDTSDAGDGRGNIGMAAPLHLRLPAALSHRPSFHMEEEEQARKRRAVEGGNGEVRSSPSNVYSDGGRGSESDAALLREDAVDAVDAMAIAHGGGQCGGDRADDGGGLRMDEADRIARGACPVALSNDEAHEASRITGWSVLDGERWNEEKKLWFTGGNVGAYKAGSFNMCLRHMGFRPTKAARYGGR